jgi:ATP:corrinoid adenosyltransferase
MALMFPRPLPEETRRDAGRAAERLLYDFFERLLPATVRVFYRFAWLAKRRNAGARDGETDFLIAEPDRGLMVLEVKGGGIARDGQTGRWTSTSRTGDVYDIKDPVEQTRKAQYALRDKLASIPAWREARVRIVRAVAFPDCKDPGQPLAADLPREMTVYADDLRYLPEKIDAIFRFWGDREGGDHHLAAHLLTLLEQILAPTFQLRLPLGSSISDDDRQIVELTAQQFDVLKWVARNRRVAVSGGAGTGKTMLAVEKAKRLAVEGYRTLLTCFNIPLAAYLRESVGPLERLTVTNFHDFCYQTGCKAGMTLVDPSDPSQPAPYYEALLHALEALPDERFDAIVVDEGQDFLETYWVALQFALSDPDDGILYVFYDDNQRLYRGGIPTGLVPIHLDQNLRNTRTIHTLAQQEGWSGRW